MSLLGCDSDGLRSKLQELREANASLVCQNHKLLNELEKVGCQLQSANNQVNVVSYTDIGMLFLVQSILVYLDL